MVWTRVESIIELRVRLEVRSLSVKTLLPDLNSMEDFFVSIKGTLFWCVSEIKIEIEINSSTKLLNWWLEQALSLWWTTHGSSLEPLSCRGRQWNPSQKGIREWNCSQWHKGLIFQRRITNSKNLQIFSNFLQYTVLKGTSYSRTLVSSILEAERPSPHPSIAYCV